MKSDMSRELLVLSLQARYGVSALCMPSNDTSNIIVTAHGLLMINDIIMTSSWILYDVIIIIMNYLWCHMTCFPAFYQVSSSSGDLAQSIGGIHCSLQGMAPGTRPHSELCCYGNPWTCNTIILRSHDQGGEGRALCSTHCSPGERYCTVAPGNMPAHWRWQGGMVLSVLAICVFLCLTQIGRCQEPGPLSSSFPTSSSPFPTSLPIMFFSRSPLSYLPPPHYYLLLLPPCRSYLLLLPSFSLFLLLPILFPFPSRQRPHLVLSWVHYVRSAVWCAPTYTRCS